MVLERIEVDRIRIYLVFSNEGLGEEKNHGNILESELKQLNRQCH